MKLFECAAGFDIDLCGETLPQSCFGAMANGHCDVNLPRCTLHRAGTFLTQFGEWLQAKGFSIWTAEKEKGNHLTPFWLYSRMDINCPAKSQIQFGCTKFASVNANVHAYARGKGKHLSSAVDLLHEFMQDFWLRERHDEVGDQDTAILPQAVSGDGIMPALVPTASTAQLGRPDTLEEAQTLAAMHASALEPSSAAVSPGAAAKLADQPHPALGPDDWQFVDMQKWKCPFSHNAWFSCAEYESLWFMPDDSGFLSRCTKWRAYYDEDAARLWWCRESTGHVFLPA